MLLALLCLVAVVVTQNYVIQDADNPTYKSDLLALPNPLSVNDSVWMEELTWMEVRDQISAGKHIALVPTGGIEQNGPFVVTGKHNYVVTALSEAIARSLGTALIAPVVKFVPEGSHSPPTGHMRFPGTIGVSEATFEALLYEICLSLKINGFTDIVLLGDSGGNQKSQREVAERFNDIWKGEGVQVSHLDDYYEYDKWGYEQLKTLGIFQLPDVQSAQRSNVHSDYFYESILATIDPELIRATARKNIGKLEINGVNLEPLDATIAIGQALIDHRATLMAEQIRQSLAQ